MGTLRNGGGMTVSVIVGELKGDGEERYGVRVRGEGDV